MISDGKTKANPFCQLDKKITLYTFTRPASQPAISQCNGFCISAARSHSTNLANSIREALCTPHTWLLCWNCRASVSSFVLRHHQITHRIKCMQLRESMVVVMVMMAMAWEIGSSGFHGIMLLVDFQKKVYFILKFSTFFVVHSSSTMVVRWDLAWLDLAAAAVHRHDTICGQCLVNVI